jgi:hypothetical protein
MIHPFGAMRGEPALEAKRKQRLDDDTDAFPPLRHKQRVFLELNSKDQANKRTKVIVECRGANEDAQLGELSLE